MSYCKYPLIIKCEKFNGVKAQNPNNIPANVTLELEVEEINNIDEILEYLEENGFLADYLEANQPVNARVNVK